MEDRLFIQWHITNLCNLRCRHCYQEDFSRGGDLDWPGLKRISDNILATLLRWKKTATIHITGGEPLLKPETFLLLDELDLKPEVDELGIITNGLCLDHDVIKRLASISKLKKIKISIDGASAEVNDAIRSPGSFERVMKNLSLIKKEERFEIILMLTVMKRNFRNLLSLLDLCQDLNIDGLIVERFIPLGRGREIMEEVLDPDQWKEMVETLLDFFSIGIETSDAFSYQAFQIRFTEGEQELSGAPCVVGLDGFCIMPDGSVLPCRRFPVTMGNLLRDRLETIWDKSEILGKLRGKENLKGKCGRCAITACRGCRSLAFSLTGDYLEEDPHCWYHVP